MTIAAQLSWLTVLAADYVIFQKEVNEIRLLSVAHMNMISSVETRLSIWLPSHVFYLSMAEDTDLSWHVFSQIPDQNTSLSLQI